MATYASLSPVEQAVVQNIVQLIRSGAGEMGKLFNHLRAIADDTHAVNLVLSLDPGETIPNMSGLAGAGDQTRAEIAAIYTIMNTARTDIDNADFRAKASKAAGINALLGA
jgi:hypothetical protein